MIAHLKLVAGTMLLQQYSAPVLIVKDVNTQIKEKMMPRYDVNVSAFIEEMEFDQKPTESDIIELFRKEPLSLLTNLEVDSIEEVKEE